MRNLVCIAVLAAGMALASGAAHADPFGNGGNHGRGGAPAPLLAAGIPAFLALGGGALVARLVRRRKV